MTYPSDFTLPVEIVEQVSEHGFDILPELMRIVFNSAMQAEREKYLGAAPYQRSAERRGHANGFKPKTVQTRVGEIHPSAGSGCSSTCRRCAKAAFVPVRSRKACAVSAPCI
jgi:hypothetical protein